MKKYIAILFLLAFTFNEGQTYDFIRFRESDGLPLSQVYTIYQHSNGAIAVGLLGGGLSLYNGGVFHNFSMNEGFINSTVNGIKEDSKGNLWIATDDGISKFDGENFENHYDRAGKVTVWRIAIDKNDNIFLATSDGLIKYDGKTFENITKTLLHKKIGVYALLITASGKLIFGSAENVWEYDNEKINKIEKFSRKNIYGIFKIGKDDILIYANDSLFSYNDKKIFGIDLINRSGYENIYSVFKDSQNNLWVSDYGKGVYKINEREVVNYNKKNGFTNSGVWSIIEDKDSNLWFGTDDGLFFLNHSKLKFYENNDLISDLWSIFVSPNNKVYIGTTKKGLFEFKNNSFRKVKLEADEDRIFYQIIQDDNGAWWGATNRGLLYSGQISPSLKKELKKFEKKNIYSVFKDRKNNIWIGVNYDGLYKFDGKHFTSILIDSAVTDVESFAEDRKNNLWIGTDVGIYKFDGNNFSYPEELNAVKRYGIDDLLIDRYRNIIWGAAFGKGVVRYDLPTGSSRGKARIYGVPEGLNDNSILSLVEDFDGNIWVGTNKGLNKIVLNNADSVTAIIPFYRSDGLLGYECVQQSASIDSTGKLLIATAMGLLAFYPNDLRNLKIEPIPKIVSLQAFNLDTTVTFSNDFLFMDTGENIKYHVPNTLNNVKINFCGLTFPSSHGTKYSYKLSGLKWSKPTYETSINYNNLEPGNYTFSVRTISHRNKNGKLIASIDFKINAPFQKTILFKIIIFFLFTLLGIFLIYIRTRSIKKKNIDLRMRLEERKRINSVLRKAKESAEKSEKLKGEFLAQMSHEIRSPIHTILSFTQLLEFELSDKLNNELKESFRAIKKAGARVVRTIDLILNMSQIQTNTFETHFRNIDLTEEILKPLYIEYSQAAKAEGLKLNFIKDADNTLIEGDEYTINQIVANLLNNAIKYTEKGEITLRVFRTEEDKLAIEVADAGIGISKEYLPKLFESFSQEEQGYTRRYDGNGLGLALVKRYCQINNADIIVESEKGKGSVFRVAFK
ncbi:MAG: hypothetical protein GXO87_11715 [Chlorobi bacterium]|nr:hypothetical protein [Chlorobiota bacterium]